MTKHSAVMNSDQDIQPIQSHGDTPKTRPCLRCRLDFPSEGFGDRICRPCKSSSVWRNGMATTYGSSSRSR